MLKLLLILLNFSSIYSFLINGEFIKLSYMNHKKPLITIIAHKNWEVNNVIYELKQKNLNLFP